MKLSLNETWKRCFKMWKDMIAVLKIASEDEDVTIDVAAIKKIWLQLNGYKKYICNDCFFCDYVENSTNGHIEDPDIPGGCPTCPGTKIDPNFACQKARCHWAENPEGFYQELIRLNRIRIARKSRKNKKTKKK